MFLNSHTLQPTWTSLPRVLRYCEVCSEQEEKWRGTTGRTSPPEAIIQTGETDLLTGTYPKQKAGSLEPPQTAGGGRDVEAPCQAPRTTWVSGLRKAAEAEFALTLSEAWPMKASKRPAEWGKTPYTKLQPFRGTIQREIQGIGGSRSCPTKVVSCGSCSPLYHPISIFMTAIRFALVWDDRSCPVEGVLPITNLLKMGKATKPRPNQPLGWTLECQAAFEN